MRQKLAFVGAQFLLDPGSRIADMGCGSGYGTYQLALLNPDVNVIGVDINPESVRTASESTGSPISNSSSAAPANRFLPTIPRRNPEFVNAASCLHFQWLQP